MTTCGRGLTLAHRLIFRATLDGATERGPRPRLKYLLKIDLLCFDRQLGVQPVQTKGGP